MNNPESLTPAPIAPRLAVAEVAVLLDSILIPLLAVVAAHGRILGDLTQPLWARISRARRLFARLLALLAAGGTPRRPGSRTWRRPPIAPDAAPALPYHVTLGAGPLPRLSRRFAWVIGYIGYRAAGCASQLNHLLQQPGVAEIIAASPGAARTMRPLCRILGIDLPPALRRAKLPPRPPTPPRQKPRPPAPPAAPPGTPDRPLPAYIRAAVRAWKRGPQKFA